jgi:hypothetical protein
MKQHSWMIPAAGLAWCAGALVAQELTPRQLFYKDDAAPAKAAPKAPKKGSSSKGPKAEPKGATPAPAAPQTSAETGSGNVSIKLQGGVPPQAQTVAYTGERPLGLRYALVQVMNGAESEVSPTATFHSGDMVRVKVEGNRDGYLYVISRGSSGNWKPLFPAADINGGDNKIVAHRGYRLPSDTQAFSFDEQAGQEQLFVIYSAEPVKDIDELIPSLAAPVVKQPKNAPAPGPMIMASAKPLDDEFVSRLRNTYSRDLIVQTVTPGQATPAAVSNGPATLPESAVYIVSKTGGRLVADIKLEHK